MTCCGMGGPQKTVLSFFRNGMIFGSCHFLCHPLTGRDEAGRITADMDALAASSFTLRYSGQGSTWQGSRFEAGMTGLKKMKPAWPLRSCRFCLWDFSGQNPMIVSPADFCCASEPDHNIARMRAFSFFASVTDEALSSVSPHSCSRRSMILSQVFAALA